MGVKEGGPGWGFQYFGVELLYWSPLFAQYSGYHPIELISKSQPATDCQGPTRVVHLYRPQYARSSTVRFPLGKLEYRESTAIWADVWPSDSVAGPLQ